MVCVTQRALLPAEEGRKRVAGAVLQLGATNGAIEGNYVVFINTNVLVVVTKDYSRAVDCSAASGVQRSGLRCVTLVGDNPHSWAQCTCTQSHLHVVENLLVNQLRRQHLCCIQPPCLPRLFLSRAAQQVA
jgi:hypothetical protein